MITGDKDRQGTRKSFMHFYFDKKITTKKNNYINDKSIFHNQFINDLFQILFILSHSI